MHRNELLKLSTLNTHWSAVTALTSLLPGLRSDLMAKISARLSLLISNTSDDSAVRVVQGVGSHPFTGSVRLLPRCLAIFTSLALATSAFANSNTTTSAPANWGATAPTMADRPDTSWTRRFNKQADVIATGDINAAIARCDQIVGRGNYCSVALSTSTSSTPFTISRSQTKVFAPPAGQPLRAASGKPSIFIGSNISQIVIENLRLAGIRSGNQPVYGIMISGSSIEDIVLRNNRFYDFDSDISAHGIIVLGSGTDNAQRIHNVTIDQNQMTNMRTGASESIAVNGNVSNWVISNNRLTNLNNIAIDAIGGEGTAPPVTFAGRVMPHPLDAARIGWIENNVVDRMSTRDNPAYGNQRSWAGAIYVDGGRRISVTGNRVTNTPWAYDIGAENCVTTENIVMRNNVAANSYYGDLRIGGYASTGYLADTIDCDPHSTEDINEGHGYVRRITVAGNRFQSSATTQSQILVEYRTTESIIAEPGLEAVNAQFEQHNLHPQGDDNAYRITE